mgnify:CR=1 FL=1
MTEIKDIIVKEDNLVRAEGKQPDFKPINIILFPSGSFSEAVYDYLYEHWGDCHDMDGEVAQWMNHSDSSWFDVLKDERGDYYYVAGDKSGIVYYGKVDAIRIIYDDYEVWFNEDDIRYYIDFLDKGGEYEKDEWTLEDALIEAEKRMEQE